MSKAFRPWNPKQSFLLPPSPLEWLPEGHLALAVLDFFEVADLRPIEDAIDEKDPRGNPPFNPRMMAALIFYGYCIGVRSSRRIESATYIDVAFRVIAGGQHPDHSAIAEFRRAHWAALLTLFKQVLLLCQRAGLVKLGHVSLDGSKVKANASKHKAMSYDRMLKTEAQIEEEIKKLLTDAEALDGSEDAQHGSNRGDEIPEELRRREERLKKIRAAKAALEADAAATRAGQLAARANDARATADAADANEAARLGRAAERAEQRAAEAIIKAKSKADDRVEAAQHAADKAAELATTPKEKRAARKARDEVAAAEHDRDDTNDRFGGGGPGGAVASLPEHHVAADKNGDPTSDAQRNFTDPESRIMKAGTGEFVQGYNCQIAVDAEHQIIVAQAVTNQAPDQDHFRPMLDLVESTCEALPNALTADAGYWSEGNAACARAKGVDAYINVGRDKHGCSAAAAADPEPRPAPTTSSMEAREAMRSKLATADGRALYRLRKTLPEPVFGQIKEARGIRAFLLRGINGAALEWSLATATHNFLKLIGALRARGASIGDLIPRLVVRLA